MDQKVLKNNESELQINVKIKERILYNPDKECRKIVERLKKICLKKGITPYMLAKNAKISNSTISYLFNGRTKPQIYTLFLICNAIDISITELFEENTVEQDEIILSKDELDFVHCYRTLSQKKKEWLKICVDMLCQYQNT